jgi:hypothetical protein
MESEATSQEKNGGGITLSQRDESGCNEFFCGMFYVVLINNCMLMSGWMMDVQIHDA